MATRDQTRDTVVDFARSLLAIDFAAVAPIEHRFRLAGIEVAVRFHDPAMAATYAGRLPLSAGNGDGVDHQLAMLHAEHLDLPMAPVWKVGACSPRQFHTLFAAEQVKVAYPFCARLWHAYDPLARKGVQLSGSRADLPPWDSGAPLRVHLHWLLSAHGLRLAHAATLGRQGRGVLIVGNGGAGKSGTCLAGLAAGMVTCGDDYVALDLRGRPQAHLMFRIIKQDREGLSRIAALDGKLDGLTLNWQGKIDLHPEVFFPGCFTERLAIEAVLLASIARGATANLVPIGRGEIMRAIMRSNLYQFPGEDDDGLAFFSKFLSQLPCFRIELASDPAANSNAIDRLLEKMGS
jgi:hypothetical protein